MIEMNFMLEMELLCCTQNKIIFNAQQKENLGILKCVVKAQFFVRIKWIFVAFI